MAMGIVNLVGANRIVKVIRDPIQLRSWLGSGEAPLAVTHQKSPAQAEGGDQLSTVRQRNPV
jgi:hypothetical protein